MKLTEEAIKEFKEIWKKEFKEDISDKKANEQGLKVLRMMKLIYKPSKKGN